MPYVKWPRGRLRVEVRTQPTLSFTMVLLLPTLLLSKSVGIILKCDKKVVAISGRLEFSFGVLSRAQQVHCSRAGSATTAMYAREASRAKSHRETVSTFHRFAVSGNGIGTVVTGPPHHPAPSSARQR